MDTNTNTNTDIDIEINKRKIYNEKYYNTNRLKILSSLNKRVECEKCKRVISYGRLNDHMKSKLCAKFSKLNFV
jgi:hypothetical protein